MSSEAITRNDLKDIINGMLPIFYPVGSYYETSDATFNPNTEWGGVWELEASGNVHVSSGTGYTLGATGGSPYIQEHNHGFSVPSVTNGSCTVTAAGGHKHSPSNGDTFQTMPGGGDGLQRKAGSISGSGYNIVYSTKASTRVYYTNEVANHQHTVPNHTHTVSGGSVNNVTNLPSGQTTGQAGNMPPYIVVNRWHRTA